MNRSLIGRAAVALSAAFVLHPIAAMAQAEPAPPEPTLPTLIVTADPLGDRTADELAQPTIVLSGEALNRKRRATIGELLSDELGVSSSDSGPGVGRPVIRGQSGARVLVLDNGIRSMDVSTIGADHANGVDVLIADQVEVIKGPYALIHGSGASGGVVNIRNRRINPDADPGLSGSGYFSYGDNADERTGAANLELGTRHLNLQADYSARRTGDFDIPGFAQLNPAADVIDREGTLENSNLSADNVGLSATAHGDAGWFGVGFSRLETEYGIPGMEGDPVTGEIDEFERILIEQDRLEARGQLDAPLVGVEALRVKFAHTDYTQQEVGFVFAGGVFDESEVEADFSNKEYEARIELIHAPIAGLSGVVGLQFNDRDYAARDDAGGDLYVPPTDTRGAAIFLVEEAERAWGRIEFGARLAQVELDQRSDGISRDFTPISLSAGTVTDLDAAHHLKLYATRTQRAPVAEELFADGPHGAAGTFERGDTELKEETNNTLDLGIDRHLGPWLWQVNVFYNRAQDYIYLATDVDVDGDPLFVDDTGAAPGDNLSVRYVQGGVDLLGGEAETSFQLLEGPISLRSRVFVDTVRGRLRDGDGNLPRITPTRYGVGIDGSLQQVGYALTLTQVGDQNKTARGETATDGYTLLSADLSYTLRTANGPIELALRGRNLLDEEIRRHTSFFKDRAPLPGRAVFASIRYDFAM